VSLPSPNLDDRTFDDIVEDVIRLIPRYCPDWTNHNPSDPGITLVELFAWMTELILYRLNRVPDKVYVTLLDLIGIRLGAPQPARSLLSFKLVEGYRGHQWVRKGTQVASELAAEGEPIIFETENDVLLTDVQLVHCLSRDRLMVSDHGEDLVTGRREGFDVFQGRDRVDMFLYVGDRRLAALKGGSTVKLRFLGPRAQGRALPLLLEWEYWNGGRWKELPVSGREGDGKATGIVAFKGPLTNLAPDIVNKIETVWLRGRLADLPDARDQTVLDDISTEILVEEGLDPDAAFQNLGSAILVPVDLSKNFDPFSPEPRLDYAFYVGSDEVFSKKGALVVLDFTLTDPSARPAPRASENVKLVWEYWSGKRWERIEATTPAGVGQASGAYTFSDTTKAFTQSGAVTFRIPETIAESEINAQRSYWLRVRIEAGDYGVPGRYEHVKDQFVWRDDRPLAPPWFKSLKLRYTMDPFFPEHCLSYNDYVFADRTEVIRTRHVTFEPFDIAREGGAALYLGFDRPFPSEPIQIYFDVVEDTVAPEAYEAFEARVLTELGERSNGPRLDRQGHRVSWEYWNGSTWAELSPQDRTKGFAVSGELEFLGPRDSQIKSEFGKECHWIRARLEMGSYSRSPKLRSIYLNTVRATNALTLRDEILGSSDGMPDQRFTFSRSPVLEGQRIVLREREMPSEKELAAIVRDEGEDAVREVQTAGGPEIWVRWHQVESFYGATPTSRCYVLDPIAGVVRFSDGRHGLIPPVGVDNIKAEVYQTGGGIRGNLGAGSLKVLRESIPYVEEVTNPLAARGGADAETLEEAKLRGPQAIKSRYRAVTAEDFEWLALKASGNVGRAKCLASTPREGEVSVVILPQEGNGDGRPMPSPELLNRVRVFLDSRRLITTVVHVVKPKYVDVSVEISVYLKASSSQVTIVKKQIEERVKRYLDPLRGGPDGKGWPFGRGLHRSDLYHLVNTVDGVDYVEEVRLFREGSTLPLDRVGIAAQDLVFPAEVSVIELVRERMV
jgi:phage-related baseplate assembly protein